MAKRWSAHGDGSSTRKMTGMAQWPAPSRRRRSRQRVTRRAHKARFCPRLEGREPQNGDEGSWWSPVLRGHGGRVVVKGVTVMEQMQSRGSRLGRRCPRLVRLLHGRLRSLWRTAVPPIQKWSLASKLLRPRHGWCQPPGAHSPVVTGRQRPPAP
jgi:hypothetical protein